MSEQFASLQETNEKSALAPTQRSDNKVFPRDPGYGPGEIDPLDMAQVHLLKILDKSLNLLMHWGSGKASYDL